MPLFYRFIADFFWNYKGLSIAVNLYCLYCLFKCLFVGKLKTLPKSSSLILIIFFFVVLNSFLIKTDDQSTKIFLKITFSCFMFFIGVYDRGFFKDSKRISLLCLCFIFIELLLSLNSTGYQFWGDTKTFSGYFFFKTDFALAVVISLSYILYFFQYRKRIQYCFILISVYLVYIANSRIHLVSAFLIIAVYFSRRVLLKKSQQYILIWIPVILCVFYIINIIVSQLNTSNNYLTIDFNNFFTAGNLQGRDQIWTVLLKKFSVADEIGKFFGLGLSADIQINNKFAEDNNSNNAHNNYLYILISLGYLGSVLFLLFSLLSIIRFVKLSKIYREDKKRSILLLMFITNTIIFFTSSFSTATLIFQQHTWFYLYSVGILYNSYYFDDNKNPRKLEDLL